MAEVLEHLHEPDAARPLFRAVVAGRAAALGPGHLETLAAKNGLANVLARTPAGWGEARARSHYHFVYTIISLRIRFISESLTCSIPQHQSVSDSTVRPNPTAVGEARRLYEEVVAGRTVAHGAGQSSTLDAKHNVALLLVDMAEAEELGEAESAGLRAEARRMYDDCVAGYARLHGWNHTATLMAKMNLAQLLGLMLGESAAAHRMHDEV